MFDQVPHINMGRLKNFVKEFSSIFYAAGFWLFMSGLDMASSYIGTTMFELEELNPFTREAFTHRYLLPKGLAHTGIYLAALLACAGMIYKGLKSVDSRVAKAAATFPFYYWGVAKLSGAVIPNFLLIFNWFAP